MVVGNKRDRLEFHHSALELSGIGGRDIRRADF
jgi:hypothetical protein